MTETTPLSEKEKSLCNLLKYCDTSDLRKYLVKSFVNATETLVKEEKAGFSLEERTDFLLLYNIIEDVDAKG